MLPMPPEIRFCRTTDGYNVAYSVMGSGPIVVAPPGWVSNLEQLWDEPLTRAGFEALSARNTYVRYDKGGTGLSDRDIPRPTLDTLLHEVEAVIRALDAPRVNLLGSSQGAPTALAFAARHPAAVERLAIYAGFANGRQLASKSVQQSMISTVRAHWGMGSRALADLFMPDAADTSALEMFARVQRVSASAEVAADMLELLYSTDVSELLPMISCPTLVVHREGDRAVRSQLGRQLAGSIPGARLLLLPGRNHAATTPEELTEVYGPISDFLAGPVETSPAAAATAESFHTILFTDLESSTALTQRVGDAAAQDVLHGHNDVVRAAVAHHRGREVKHTGDGIMADFSSSEAAVNAASEIERRLTGAEVRVRIGVNAGEPIVEDGDLFGTAVQLAARICDRAEPGEVLVSNVVRELCAGKMLTFENAGTQTIKGFAEPVQLWRVVVPE